MPLHFTRFLCFLVAVVSTLLIAHAQERAPAEKREREAKLKSTLDSMRDVMRLKTPVRQRTLFALLIDNDVLSSLDTEGERRGKSAYRLQLTKVLEDIAKLPAAESNALLAQLAKEPAYRKDYQRTQALMIACRYLPEARLEVLAFLDEVIRPNKPSLPTGIQTLVQIGSNLTCMMLEKRLLQMDFSVRERMEWLTYCVPARTNPNIVAMYSRLAEAEITDQKLRDWVFDTLFNYRGETWFNVCDQWPDPPKWEDADSAVLREILAIGSTVPKAKLSEYVAEDIEKSCMRIRKVLDARTKGETKKRKS